MENYNTENFISEDYLSDILEEKMFKLSKMVTEVARDADISGIVRKSIFLSHSHLDKKIVNKIKVYFNSINYQVYIDWEDQSMPKTTNRKTAEKIKNKIGSCNHFMVVATENAMKSRWVPWEIGIADENKSGNGISIIPFADKFGRFSGNEYLQLYPRIEVRHRILEVISPGKIGSERYSNWLEKL